MSSSRSIAAPCIAAVASLAVSLLGQAPITTTAVPMPGAAKGWTAHTIHQGDAGIWYAHVAKAVPWYGQNEILATDDKGRFLLLAVYSGNWTAYSCTPDGQWLAPSRPADVDPRVPGHEFYAAGRGGSLHRVTMRDQPFARFSLESCEIAHVRHEEFHTVIAADLLPEHAGDELLAFAISGAVYRLTAGTAGDSFAMQKVATMPGRVRDVVVAPAAAGKAPELIGVSRSGDLVAMQLGAGELTHRLLLHEDSGLGRVAASPVAADVFYVTRDDGLLLRVHLGADGKVERQPMLATRQGLRGVAAGRFFADGREAVACYGYGQTVEMVTRRADGTFAVEALLTTVQKGHWLAVGELDGRNNTDELVATGFDGTVVLLAREPGYGLAGVAVPEPEAKAKPNEQRPRRIAARFGPRATEELSPLRYQGGFETKALVYETLVTQAPDGSIAPGLAKAWRTEDGGRVHVLTLRDGATFGDGSPVTAAAVAEHCRRWVGLPEHDWLGSNRRIVSVRAVGTADVRFELDRPFALLPDLCALNPTAVRAPSALSREGDFVRPIGSGPFAVADVLEDGNTIRYRDRKGGGTVDLVRVDGDPLAALRDGEVDAVVGTWMVPVDAAAAAALRGEARFVVADAPGSSVWLLTLRTDAGPLRSLPHRQAVAAAIDRGELIARAAGGLAEPALGLAAPSITTWPAGKVPARPAGVTFAAPLRLLRGEASEALVAELVAQFARNGIAIELVDKGASDWDVRCERTHGAPYDPFLTVVQRFAPGPSGRDEELGKRVAAMQADPDTASFGKHFAQIQQRLDELVCVVPLFAPRRIAVVRAGLPMPTLTPQVYALDPKWLAALAR